MIEYEHIQNTPFTIVTTEDGHMGVMGKHQITKIEEDKNILKEELKTITWNRIIQVVAILKDNEIK